MKIHPTLSLKRGFTLMELMVAMAITTIIVTVLVSITAMATDTWNRSRTELRASRQAKTMVDTMARDFESMVVRRSNNDFEWLSALVPTSLPGSGNLQSTNACDLIFLSGSMDRYDGNIGNIDAAKGPVDKGGDVSGIGYRLDFKDPIDKNGTIYKTFVFKRLLVNPDETFKNLLGKPDLKAAFDAGGYPAKLDNVDNFVCENIYQFTVTFHVEGKHTTGTGTTATTQMVSEPISIINGTGSSFKINKLGIDTASTPKILSESELKAGRVTAVEISLTVLSDLCIDQLNRRTFSDTQKADFLMKNSFNYSKRVPVSCM